MTLITILKAKKWIRNTFIAEMVIFISGCGMYLQEKPTLTSPLAFPDSPSMSSPLPTAIVTINTPLAKPIPNASPIPVALDAQRWVHFDSPLEVLQAGFYGIAQARDEAMWFIGLSDAWKIYRYDQKNWTVYNPDDISIFRGKAPQSLAADHDGTMWFGTDQNEIVSFNGKTWKSQTVENGGYRENTILSIIIRKNGELCAISVEGMSCRSKGKWIRHRIAMPKNIRVSEAVLTFQDNIWLSLSNGLLYFYDGNIWESYRISQWIGPVAARQDGSLWIFTNEGLGKRNRSGKVFYLDLPSALWANPAFSLYEMDDGTLWYGCGSGDSGLGVVLYRIDEVFETIDGKILKKRDNPFLYSYRYPFGNVNKIVQSKDGAVWLATDNGIFRYSLNK